MYNPKSGKRWIELRNWGTQPINVGNWVITDNPIDKPRRFVFKAGTIIPAGAFVVYDETFLGFSLKGEDNLYILNNVTDYHINLPKKFLEGTAAPTSSASSIIPLFVLLAFSRLELSQPSQLFLGLEQNLFFVALVLVFDVSCLAHGLILFLDYSQGRFTTSDGVVHFTHMLTSTKSALNSQPYLPPVVLSGFARGNPPFQNLQYIKLTSVSKNKDQDLTGWILVVGKEEFKFKKNGIHHLVLEPGMSLILTCPGTMSIFFLCLSTC